MKIPKIISKNKREYILVKEYKNYILYKDMITECMECFTKHELGLVRETIKDHPKEGLIGKRKYF